MEFRNIDWIKCELDDNKVEEIRSSLEYQFIKKGIDSTGLFIPILIDDNSHIIDGKKRYLAYKELGYRDVPIAYNESDIKNYIKDTVYNNTGMKKNIVAFIRSIGIGVRPASRLLNIPKSTLQDWIRIYSSDNEALSLLRYLSYNKISEDELIDILKIARNALYQYIDDLISMGIKINIEEVAGTKYYSLSNPLPNDWTKYLSIPRTIEDISQYLNIPDKLVSYYINARISEGWDIRNGIINNREVYFFGGTHTKINTPTFHNIIQVPFAIVSDLHIGSKWFDQQALEEAFHIIENNNIKYILMPGDILQGVGVFSRESLDLSTLSIEDQIKMARDILSEYIPMHVAIHVIIGNHEEAVKSKSKFGFDPLLSLLNQLRLKRPDININYYGYDALLVVNNLVRDHEILIDPHNPRYISIQSPYLIYMIHGSGKGSYAISYPAQKILRSLHINADMLIVGHYHKLAHFKVNNKEVIMSSTFQGKNHFFTGMGNDTQKGFVIVNGTNMQDNYYTKPLINLIPFD